MSIIKNLLMIYLYKNVENLFQTCFEISFIKNHPDFEKLLIKQLLLLLII